VIAVSVARSRALLADGRVNNPFFGWGSVTGQAVLTTPVGAVQAEGPAAHAGTDTTYDAWMAQGSGGQAVLQAVFGAPVTVGFAGIAAHNLGTLGATARVEYSTDGGSVWLDCGAGPLAAADNGPMGWRIAPTAAALWRFRVTGLSGAPVVRIAVAALAQELVLSQRMYQGVRPVLQPTEVDLQSNVSEGGNLLGSAVVRRGATMTYALEHLRPEEVRGAAFQGFQERFNAGAGFFTGWRPGKYPGDLHYGWRSGSPLAPANGGVRDMMDAEIAFRVHHG
jgi:hypothetical protein